MSGKNNKAETNDANNAGGTKRKYHNQSNNKDNYHNNRSKYNNNAKPKRGAPGILLTCETGRENRSKREIMDILHYYQSAKIQNSNKKEEDDNNSQKQKMSLEDELDSLRSNKHNDTTSNNNNNNTPFQSYDTGCRGTVFIYYNNDNTTAKEDKDNDNDEDEEDKSGDNNNKRQKQQDKNDTSDNATTEAPETKESTTTSAQVATAAAAAAVWNPLDTVRDIFEGILKNDNSEIPSSRFIMRLIPLQVTCFASIAEITETIKTLVQVSQQSKEEEDNKSSTTKTKTFGIHFKRRNCGNVKRDEVIDAIAKVIGEMTPWKVDLKDPDYRIQVEICKTLCGISMFPKEYFDDGGVQPKFNISDARGAAAELARTEASSDT